MNQILLRWLIRPALFGTLAGLLLYAWLTDRPSPAYPSGRFGELVVSALVLVGLVGAVVFAWRSVRRRRDAHCFGPGPPDEMDAAHPQDKGRID